MRNVNRFFVVCIYSGKYSSFKKLFFYSYWLCILYMLKWLKWEIMHSKIVSKLFCDMTQSVQYTISTITHSYTYYLTVAFLIHTWTRSNWNHKEGICTIFVYCICTAKLVYIWFMRYQNKKSYDTIIFHVYFQFSIGKTLISKVFNSGVYMMRYDNILPTTLWSFPSYGRVYMVFVQLCEAFSSDDGIAIHTDLSLQWVCVYVWCRIVELCMILGVALNRKAAFGDLISVLYLMKIVAVLMPELLMFAQIQTRNILCMI